MDINKKLDLYFGFGFAYPVTEANALNTIKNLEQKILYQFGLPSYISLDQRPSLLCPHGTKIRQRNTTFNGLDLSYSLSHSK